MPNPPINPNGLTPEQAAAEYRQGDSTVIIARRWNTNPKQVGRLLERAGCPRRTREQAQQNARDHGRVFRNKKKGCHDLEHRKKISEGQTKRWASMTPEDRESQAEQSRKNLKNRDDGGEFAKAGGERLRQASKEGSKLSRSVREALSAARLKVQTGDVKVAGRTIRPCCLVCENGFKKVAVLVRGPTHFRPVFGEDKLRSQQESDQAAVGILTAEGYSVLVVEVTKRTLGRTSREELLKEVVASVPRSQKQQLKIVRV